MNSTCFCLFGLVTFTVTFADPANAESLFDAWPTCDTAAGAEQASEGYWRLNSKQMETLGCVIVTPQDLHVRAIRCAPSALDHEPAWFSYPVERDPALPKDVCEIEASLPDGWKANLYTKFMNIWWSNQGS